MEYRRKIVFTIPLRLIYSVVDIQLFSPFNLDMYARKTDYIGVAVRSAVLLASSAFISISTEYSYNLKLSFLPF